MSFAVVPPKPKRPSILLQIMAALAAGLVLFLLGAGLITGGYQMLFSGRIFPGVLIAGVDLSNLTPGEAESTLNQRLVYPTDGRIVFRDGSRVWTATPAQLGMAFDAGTSVQRAYKLGRQGGWFNSLAGQINAWQGGLELPPVIVIDERVAHVVLQAIASQIDRPVVETDLHLDGTTVINTPGQTGRFLNVDETLKNLMQQMEAFKDGEIPLVISEQPPLILEASAQAEMLGQALSGPLMLTFTGAQPGDPGPWTIDADHLASMFSIGRVQTGGSWQYQISMDDRALELFIGGIAPQVNRDPQNARFYFDDGSRQLVLVKPSETGRTLDVAGTRTAIEQKLLQGEHSIPLIIAIAQPAVSSDATAASLGITSLVSEQTSYFRYSSAARMQNIQAATSRNGPFYGLLVPPNTTFSMGDAMGDISLDNGYAEALIIYNGQTITGVGGGVCQVSTTLFRTAYFGGYPIEERHEHAYRVLYYEQTANGYNPALAGLDATVYFPLVDLKFTNDRPYWLLMETYFNADEHSLTWKFYSGDDGRSVDVQNLGMRNVVPAPDPLFVENPDLAPGTCKQVDYSADGADITVTRSVTLNGQRLSLNGDTIRTHYEPWQAVYQVGTGTDNPQSLLAQGLCGQ